jgi:hypothetical protein
MAPMIGKSAGQVATAKIIYAYFIGVGFHNYQAVAPVGNADEESGLNPEPRPGDGGSAVGLFQMHPDRTGPILHAIGVNMRNASAYDQCRGVWWELQHTESDALHHLRMAGNAYAAGYAFGYYYERPAALVAESVKRGHLAQQWLAALQ